MAMNKDKQAAQTAMRQEVEDCMEAIDTAILTFKRQGRIADDVEPLIASTRVRSAVILVLLSNGQEAMILPAQMDRNTLDGV